MKQRKFRGAKSYRHYQELTIISHSSNTCEIYVIPIIQIASFLLLPNILTFLKINAFFLCARLFFCCNEC